MRTISKGPHLKALEEKIRAHIRIVPDFPIPGISFKDISPILAQPSLCREIIRAFFNHFQNKKIDAIVGVESRGFIFGMPLSLRMRKPFVIVRKVGKLPGETVSYTYELEYGKATMEIQKDAIKKGWRVLIHDDLLATGGTASAAAELVRKLGGEVAGFAFLVELPLQGRTRLEKYTKDILTLVKYEQ